MPLAREFVASASLKHIERSASRHGGKLVPLERRNEKARYELTLEGPYQGLRRALGDVIARYPHLDVKELAVLGPPKPDADRKVTIVVMLRSVERPEKGLKDK